MLRTRKNFNIFMGFSEAYSPKISPTRQNMRYNHTHYVYLPYFTL